MAKLKLADAYVQIIPSAKGIKQGLTEIFDSEGKGVGGKTGETVGSNFASRAVSVIKNVVAAAGLGMIFKEAIDQGAALEQSLGGVETLFKDSADKVIANAKNAYRTAGMSANEYMETVTGFSASLLQGLAGDTSKAADIADMALTDMSDNANKMGTSMESIQNAYQGFAKQNYTMLDNLKLGYGGTQAEMARLLEDAQKLSGVKYDMSNLSDVYSAIHAIQDDLGITGTTADEAAGTVSGSLASMKAAAQDLLGNIALGDGVQESFAALISTTGTFLTNNLIPMAFEALSGFGSAIESALSVLNVDGSKMIETGISLIENLASGLTSALPELIPFAIETILSLATSFVSNMGSIVDVGISILTALVEGIVNSIPMLVETVPGLINDFWAAFDENAIKLLQAGFELIVKLGDGIVQNLPLIIEHAGEIAHAIFTTISHLDLLSAGKTLITNLASGAKSMLGAVGASADSIAQSIWNTIKTTDWLSLGKNVITFLKDGISGMLTSVGSAGGNIAKAAWNAIKGVDWLGLGKNVITFLINGVKGMIGSVASALVTLAKTGMSAFLNADWIGIGKNIVKGIASGLVSAAGSIVQAAKDAANKALNAAKKALGIHSPSTAFEKEVGEQSDKGWAIGVAKNASLVTDALKKVSRDTIAAADGSFPTMAWNDASRAAVPGNSIADRTGKGSLEGAVLEIANQLILDGRVIKELITQYVIEAIDGQQKAVLRTKGVY